MVKVTVLYNLPPGTDEEEFLEWRMTAHHKANIARPGVMKSDFFRVTGTPRIGAERPESSDAPYRFMTEAYYESETSFLESWNDPDEQARLVPAVAKIADSLFLISEELQSWEIEE